LAASRTSFGMVVCPFHKPEAFGLPTEPAFIGPEEAVRVRPAVVRVQIDVHARNLCTLKLKDTAEPAARRRPLLTILFLRAWHPASILRRTLSVLPP